MSAIDLLALFRRELELCKVHQGETMAVLSGPGTRPDYVAAFIAAGQQLGAEVFHLNLPQPVTAFRQTPTTAQGALWGITPLTGHRSGVEILKRADILIDLIGLLHSPEQLDIQKAGTRVLMVVEPPDILARMLAREDTRPRVEAAGRKIAAASTLRITSPAGTDLTYRLGQYSHSPILQYGYTDQPGRWDHFPGAFAYTWPNEGESEGVIVLREGDIIYPFKEFVRGNVRITVRNGFITDIEGGFDAEHLAHFLAAWNDPDAYAMAHIGWGLDEMALWNGISLINKETAIGQDGRAFYGNVLWSTGPNTDVGGTRNTPAHLDIVMKGASLYLDGEPMVLDGDVIPADQRVPSPGAR
ncbi:2,5-dihydroxypyridine 5,6-dioxygenase [Cupriavidus gilardii]|uniref:2,5-dihydroxypyridine 5,6-dioxygenase n=1 Tax=Cupriavidus gilardii TaxID=82541 RepID=UPI0021C22D6D|nr:2,5-dihydroxypyridine 5,6-dioxygenase [Cupriavidus gilardii]MCT9116081.1 2,5-dihydroxypyridine 5,6-dioxygenase [Cupriavidus gilardii]